MMRYFATLLFVQLKSVLRSAAFYVSTAFFLAVMLLLAAVLPENNGVNLQVGVTVSGDIASTAANADAINAKPIYTGSLPAAKPSSQHANKKIGSSAMSMSKKT